MTKKIHYDIAKVNQVPRGMSWMPVTHELYNSVAWRALPINAKRLVEFLMLENMSSKRMENKKLKAPYNQLEEFGISRGLISEAIGDAVSLGLIKVEYGKYRGFCRSECNLFELTFEAVGVSDSKTGAYYYKSPTNEWRKITKDDVEKWKQGKRLFKQKKKEKKLKSKC